MTKSLWILVAATLGCVGLSACAPVACRYHRPKNKPLSSAPAHLELSVWSEAQARDTSVGHVVLDVAKGLIGTRRNFLIAEERVEKAGDARGCSDTKNSLLRLEVREASTDNAARASLTVVAHLTHCETGATLWHAERRHRGAIHDTSLTALSHAVAEKLGEQAALWAAPAFLSLQPLIEDMPNCVLTEDEVLERIELGSLSGPTFG